MDIKHIYTSATTVIMCLILLCISYCTAACAFSTNATAPSIVIDAGHGGEDGGATSVSGIPESTTNLMVALKFEQLLAFCGINPDMTRRNKEALSTEGQTVRERKVSDLRNRVAFVNQLRDPILVSIHQNYFPNNKYRGAQVFYAPSEGSKQFALYAQKALRTAQIAPENREIKLSDSVYLMNKVRCPAILVECGFISNFEEDRLLQSDEYQKRIVCALCGAIIDYLMEREVSCEG